MKCEKSHSPSTPWDMMDLLADYMFRKFSAWIRNSFDTANILPHVNIPAEMVCEADRMVDMLAIAQKNDGASCA